ncbi:amidohydrolase family protein [Acetobacteraceae bacterium]|nr:amidohydrolase family protein [Candidatus Parcubacteria bacterium]
MIDVHTHIFNEESYASYKKRANGRVEKALTIHIAPHGPTQYPTLESLLLFIEGKNDLAIIASIDAVGDIPRQLSALEERIKENKIVGLKLYPGYQPFSSNDPRIIPVAQFCARHSKPLMIHTGDVEDPDRVALLRHAHPSFVDDLAVAVPTCTIIIAHLGFPYLLEAVNVISKNKNVYGDMSGTLMDEPGINPKALTEQYIADVNRALVYFPNTRSKVLFGTDYSGEHLPLRLFDEYIEVVEKVFDQSEREWVYSGLAKKLFNL